MSERTLLAGPWIGEFGYELCQWQGIVRREAAKHDRTIVVTYPSHEGMYRDFTQDVRPLPDWFLAGHFEPDGLAVHGDTAKALRQRLREWIQEIPHTTWLRPQSTNVPCAQQTWADWRGAGPVDPRLIVLVTRHRALATFRNWRPANWKTLGQAMEDMGYQVQYADCDWDQSLDLFGRCALAAGASTGGMHLASLCQCPHYVWGQMDLHIRIGGGYTLSERYTQRWNPFRAPVLCGNLGWQPSVNQVLNGILQSLRRIGRPQHKHAPCSP